MSDRFAQELSSLCEWDAFPQRQPALDGERRHRSVNINLLSPPNIEGVEIASKSFEPDLPKLEPRLHDPLNSSILAPAAILRLRRNQNWKPELLYWDDGSLITLLTTAALDPTGRRLIAGGVIEPYFIVCELGNDSSYSD
ncbi:hypothetical protein H2204_013039 [Knufia peltigerae]|uniref:Uncharacterized protein n=1 Tax=Knufia peltigerae TaxID=1002370 RepID=A0AA39CRQ4_9EURO|nr:hypothetical protein H2204_013039 [Knufia peltigerae]